MEEFPGTDLVVTWPVVLVDGRLLGVSASTSEVEGLGVVVGLGMRCFDE